VTLFTSVLPFSYVVKKQPLITVAEGSKRRTPKPPERLHADQKDFALLQIGFMQLRIWKQIYLSPLVRLKLYTQGFSISVGHSRIGWITIGRRGIRGTGDGYTRWPISLKAEHGTSWAIEMARRIQDKVNDRSVSLQCN
jgi:hypothetical protein